MTASLVPRPGWTQRPGETILREITVDAQLRDRGEGKRPQYLYLVGLPLLAGYLFWPVARDLAQAGWDWSSLLDRDRMSGLVGVILVLGLWVFLLRPRTPSRWLDMARYVFTEQRISLLDGEGRVMDEIKSREIDDVILTSPQNGQPPYSVDCLRAADPDLERMFSVLYVDDPEEIFDFVRTTYL